MRTAFKSIVILVCTLGMTVSAHAGLKEGLQAYRSGNYKLAFTEFEPIAKHGQPEAQFRLGSMYQKGEGVARDCQQAVAWYRKAAEQGNVSAQYNLGSSYYTAEGIQKDLLQAHKWLNLSAIYGHREAFEKMGGVESQMSSEQIQQAQILAKQWQATRARELVAKLSAVALLGRLMGLNLSR